MEHSPVSLTAHENVIGYEGRYTINRLGEVYSVTTNKVMKIQTDDSGYLCVGLHTKGKPKHKGRIHRLLAIQYIPNPDNLPEVDHIDRNKQNNDLSNLRWVTHSTNCINKTVCLHLKTEEEWEDHVVKRREYKTLKAREYMKTRKENETPEQRAERLQKNNERKRILNAKKANSESVGKPPKVTPLTETPEQREERLAKTREYSRKSKEKKKQQQMESADV
jgi:hypothetical protein